MVWLSRPAKFGTLVWDSEEGVSLGVLGCLSPASAFGQLKQETPKQESGRELLLIFAEAVFVEKCLQLCCSWEPPACLVKTQIAGPTLRTLVRRSRAGPENLNFQMFLGIAEGALTTLGRVARSLDSLVPYP